MSGRIDRRGFLIASLASLSVVRSSYARGRVLPGGTARFRLPWALALDPHRLDPTSALLAPNVFETLYRLEAPGGPRPELASALPTVSGRSVFIPLETGLLLSNGAALTPKLVRAALERASRGRGRFAVERLGPIRASDDGIVLPDCSLPAHEVVRTLGSSGSAIAVETKAGLLGTGPFSVAILASGGFALVANRHARAGSSYLERIEIEGNREPSDSLRAFERTQDDLGFGGLGLFENRKGATLLPRIGCGLFVLRPLQKPWDVPGVAQRVCNGLSPKLFAGHLTTEWNQEAPLTWPGADGDLIVEDRGFWFSSLANLVAGALSTKGHSLTVRAIPSRDFAEATSKRTAAMALDWIDPVSRTPNDVLAALAALDSPVRAREVMRASTSPKVSSLRTLGQSTFAGILGEGFLQFGVTPDLVGLDTSAGYLDWEAAYRSSLQGLFDTTPPATQPNLPTSAGAR